MKKLSCIAILLFGTSTNSFAAPGAEEIFHQYIASLNQIELISVTTGAVKYDQETDKLTVKDISISLDYKKTTLKSTEVTTADGTKLRDVTHTFGVDFDINSNSYVIAGLKAAEDGFTASSWIVSNLEMTGELTGGETAFSLSATADAPTIYKNMYTPFLPALEADPAKQVSRFIPFIKKLITARADRIDIPAITGILKSGNTTQVFVQGKTVITGLDNGRIEYVQQGPGRNEIVSDKKSETFKSTQESTEVNGYDFGLLLAALDPDDTRLTDKYRLFLGSSHSTNLGFSVAGIVTGKIDNSSSSNWQIRRPEMALLPLLDLIAAGEIVAEEQIGLAIFELIRAFKIGSWSTTGISFDYQDNSQQAHFELGKILLGNLGADRLGEFLISQMVVTVGEKASMKLGSFSIRDLVFAPMQGFRNLILGGEREFKRTNPIDQARSVLPTNIDISISDFELVVPDEDLDIALAEGHIRLGTTLPPVPTHADIAVRNFKFPVSLIDDRNTRMVLESLGFKTLTISEEFVFSWDENTNRFDVSALGIAADKLGSITSSFSFGGFPRAVIEDPETAKQLMATITLRDADILFENEGAVEAGLQFGAKEMHKTEAQLKKLLFSQVQSGLQILQNPAFESMIKSTLEAFLSSPGNVHITANPEAPVPLSQLLGLGAAQPGTIPDILNITVTAND
ncbi:MAG: hypothetical protein JKY49_12270 [Cohaesibacteraceae bacterium]|nr:hypothetical protein [Cohaesibacteraceae bacterium]